MVTPFKKPSTPNPNTQSVANTVSLPVGTPVVSCEKYVGGNPESCAPNNKIENTGNTGQLTYENGQLVFSSPSVSECIPDPSMPSSFGKCNSKIELDLIAIDDPKFLNAPHNRFFVESLKTQFPALLQADTSHQSSQNTSNHSGTSDTGIENHSQYFLWGGLSLAAIATLITIFLYFNRSSGKKKTRMRMKPDYVTPSSLFTSSNTSTPAVSGNSQIAALNSSFSRISTKLDQIENDILSLSQRVSSLETINLSAAKPRVSMLGKDAMSMPTKKPSTPTQISTDIIKKALLTGDYQSIRDSEHVFLSETLESQQGLMESKVFATDGTRDQSDQCSQSEFIAIYHDGVHYLIPNILPNAANPSRTIKRHADVNNIFSYGTGANIQNLATLPTLEKTGNNYRLASKGQIV